MLLHCVFTVPTPNVSVTAPSPQRVGQQLTLSCQVTVVRGITSRVDIIWRSGNGTVLRIANDTSSTIISSSMQYTDNYNIPRVLNTTDDGAQYQCEAVINTSPSIIMATDSITLEVTGKKDALVAFV